MIRDQWDDTTLANGALRIRTIGQFHHDVISTINMSGMVVQRGPRS